MDHHSILTGHLVSRNKVAQTIFHLAFFFFFKQQQLEGTVDLKQEDVVSSQLCHLKPELQFMIPKEAIR